MLMSLGYDGEQMQIPPELGRPDLNQVLTADPQSTLASRMKTQNVFHLSCSGEWEHFLVEGF